MNSLSSCVPNEKHLLLLRVLSTISKATVGTALRRPVFIHLQVDGIKPSLPKASLCNRDAPLRHGLFLKHHISRVFNRQDAKYAKFPRRCLSAG
ncbi:MAG: hypothetical protein WCR06_12350, partial [bacterium]